MVGLEVRTRQIPGPTFRRAAAAIAVVRALATSPGLLLLDEPLSALDARVRLELRGKLKDLQRRFGVTTIW